MIEKPYVIYHHPCADGFTAAWVFHLVFGDDATFAPMSPGDDPPDDIAGRNVYVLDMSFGRGQLIAMSAVAASLTVLDHHESAADVLEGLGFATYDPDHSGAWLAFRHVTQNHLLPTHGNRALLGPVDYVTAAMLVEVVQDGDLWKFDLFDSRAINAALSAEPFEFSRWTTFAQRLRWSKPSVVSEGNAILRYQEKQIEEAIEKRFTAKLDGSERISAVADVPHQIVSETLSRLAGEDGVAAAVRGIFPRIAELTVSLQSGPGGPNVADIAKRYRGGGHAHAAGFRVPLKCVDRGHDKFGPFVNLGVPD